MTTRFEQLQSEHQALLDRVQHEGKSESTIAAVRAYIEAAKSGAEQVPSMRDRNQLRAILRYWGSWIYEQTGVFPETTLRPPQAAAEPEPGSEQPRPSHKTWIIAAAGGGLLLLILVIMIAALSGGRRPAATPPPYQGSTDVAELPATLPAADMTESAPTAVSAAGSPATATRSPASGSASLPPTAEVMTFTPAPAATATRIIVPMMRTQVAPTRAAAQPTATLRVLPPASGFPTMVLTTLPSTGGGISVIEPSFILASGCESRSLTLSTRGSGSPQVAQVQIFEAGSAQPLTVGRLPLDGNNQMTFDLPDPQQNKTYLVKVKGDVRFEASLVPFLADCSRNHMTLTYDISDMPSGDTTISGASDLGLDWQVINWGPLPGKAAWTATLYINAQGNGSNILWQNATYWNLSGDQAVLLPDQKLVVTAGACAPADIVIGVTAAGETASESIHLRLWSPECSGL